MLCVCDQGCIVIIYITRVETSSRWVLSLFFFQKYFDEDLPVSTLGFSSVLHLLTSTPVCEVERPTGLGDWLVFRRGGPRPKGELSLSLSLLFMLPALSRCDLFMFLSTIFQLLKATSFSLKLTSQTTSLGLCTDS